MPRIRPPKKKAPPTSRECVEIYEFVICLACFQSHARYR